MRVGDYEILGEVGRGGSGVVLRARTSAGREVAIKVLAGASAETRARFEREARLLATFTEAAGFVPLIDTGVRDGAPFLVMPFVGGGTLRGRLQGAIGVPETIALGVTLARAVGRAHARGVVHRDLKPENIIFTTDGRPLVADLGLAKHFASDAPGASQSVALSQAGAFRGTIGYAAPEQTRDASAVGPAADVFALGAILYECLAGEAAFAGESALEVFARIESGLVEPLRRLRPEVPVWLERVVERALAHDVAARFPDGDALAAALEAREALPSRRRWALVALAVLMVLVAAVAAVWIRDGRLARESLARAEERLAAGDDDGAIAAATLCLEREPRSARAFAVRGEARCGKRDGDGALADAGRALELAPGLALAWSVRGAAKVRKGDDDGGIADFDRAIELDPKLAFAWQHRAWARMNKKDPVGAIRDLDRAIELDPRVASAWADRSEAKGTAGQYAAAVADGTRAVELDPGLARGWVSRGSAKLAQEDFGGAFDDLSRGLTLDPSFAQAWSNRAAARAPRGDVAGAVADITRAIDLDPTLAEAWLNRGVLDLRGGDDDGAIRDFERFLALAPAHRMVAEVRRQIASIRASRDSKR
jgi:tetratricopeptide (TPR) repeat protein